MLSLLDHMAYDRWANRRFFDALDKVDSELISRELGSSFPSIRETLAHIAWAEWIWAERWLGRSPRVPLDPDQFPTVASVRSYLQAVEETQVRFLEGLSSGSELNRIRYTNLKGEEWEYNFEEMVHHVTMHSAFHRGQIATMMRQLGIAPPSTDYLVYVDELNGTLS